MWHGVVVSHASTTSTLAINIGFALPGGLVIVLSVVVSLAFAFQLTSRLTPAASKPGDLKAAPWQGAAAAVIDPVFSIPRLDVRYQVPNDALFVWCSRPNRFFDFGNYLGVMSAIRNMSPDNVVLYYDAEPPVDDKHYHTWLAEIADNFPFFRKEKSPAACHNDSAPDEDFIDEILRKKGGVYIDDAVVLTTPFHEYRALVSSA